MTSNEGDLKNAKVVFVTRHLYDYFSIGVMYVYIYIIFLCHIHVSYVVKEVA